MILRPAVAPLLVCCVLLAGCGAGGKGASTTSTTAKASTATTADPTVVRADRAWAQKVFVVASDLSSDWKANPPEEDSPSAVVAADLLNGCVGLSKNAEIQVMKSKGNKFTNQNNVISSDVRSLKSEKLVKQDQSGMTNSKNFQCIANVVDAQLSTSLGDGRAFSSVSKLNGIATGDTQFAIRITTAVTANGATQNIYSDLLGISNGRYEVSINVTYFGTPPPAGFERQLLGSVARHMAAA